MTSPISSNIRSLTLTLALAFLVTSIGAAYWTVLASDQLANDPFNPRLIAATNGRPRGAIVDRNGAPIATSEKTDTGFARSYKDRTLAQVVGYASSKFGLAGIEAAYAESLIGQDPADPVSIWRARYLGDRSPAGQVVLGIDLKIQKAAADALGGRKGAIVALDPRTGTILASVSVPSYDANQIVDPSKQDAAFDQLNHDAGKPLLNRVAQGLYPPGSVFKVITGAAALEAGFDPTKKLRVDDPYQADKSWGDYFVRSSSRAHGLFDMSDGFRLSENIYFAQVGLQIGAAKLTDYARRFGIGSTPSLDLPRRKASSRTPARSTGRPSSPTRHTGRVSSSSRLSRWRWCTPRSPMEASCRPLTMRRRFATPTATSSVRSRPAQSGRSSRPPPRRP